MDDEQDADALIAEMRKSSHPVDHIVVAIWSDVTGRRAWRQEWDNFTPDIQVEILNEWADKIRAIVPSKG